MLDNFLLLLFVIKLLEEMRQKKKMFQGDKKYLHVQNDCPFFQSIYMDVFVLGIELLQKRKKTFSSIQSHNSKIVDAINMMFWSKNYKIVFSVYLVLCKYTDIILLHKVLGIPVIIKITIKVWFLPQRFWLYISIIGC